MVFYCHFCNLNSCDDLLTLRFGEGEGVGEEGKCRKGGRGGEGREGERRDGGER